MSLKIVLELSDADLKHFRGAMRKASSTDKPVEEVVAAARELIAASQSRKLPAFVKGRLGCLEQMVDMLADQEWKISGKDRQRIASALAYFADAEDLIPDSIPTLGFVDDAIMIELVTRELKHDMEAYRDFCVYRANHEARLKGRKDQNAAREAWLADRRAVLQSRMRRRRRSGTTRYIWG